MTSGISTFVCETRFEGLDYGGIEGRAHAFHDRVSSLDWGHAFAVRTIADHRVVRVGDGDDAGFNRNFFAFRWMVAGAVKLVVMGEDDGQNPAKRSADGTEHPDAFFHVGPHLLHFAGRRAARLCKGFRG